MCFDSSLNTMFRETSLRMAKIHSIFCKPLTLSADTKSHLLLCIQNLSPVSHDFLELL